MPDSFDRLFPTTRHHFTIEEIAVAVHKSEDQVREAQNTLARRDSTSGLVQPLDGHRPAHYSPEAARQIARHLVKGEERETLRRDGDRCRDDFYHELIEELRADREERRADREVQLQIAQQQLQIMQQQSPILRVLQIVARVLLKNFPPDPPQNPPSGPI